MSIICRNCTYHKQSSKGYLERNFITGRGNKSSEVMVVFDSLFMNDLYSEQIVSDNKYNNLFNKYLKQIGLDLDSVYVTTFIKCFISDKKKKPTKLMKSKCFEYLDKELKEVKPKVVFVVGSMVTQWFVKDMGARNPVKQVVGKSFYNSEYNCQVIPIFDMYYLTNFSNKSSEVKQTEKAFALAQVFLQKENIEKTNKIAYSYELEDLNSLGDIIAVDVETTGLNPRKDKIVTISLTDIKTYKTVAFDLESYGGVDKCNCKEGQILNQDRIERLKKTKTDKQKEKVLEKYPEYITCDVCKGSNKVIKKDLSKNKFYTEVLPYCYEIMKKRKLIFHNASFDLQMLQGAGYDLFDNLISDTRMMQFLINPLGVNALGFLVQLYYGVEYKEEIDRSYIISMDMEDRRYYCAEDTYYTSRLFKDLYKKLKDQDSLTSNKVLTNTIKILASDLEYVGIKIDEQKAYEIIDYYQAEKDKLELKFKKRFDLDDAFNLNSPKQLCKLLYEDLGLPVMGRTKTKNPKTGEYNPSTDEEAVMKLASKRPALKSLVEYRTAAGHIAKIKQYLRFIENDGRIHGSFNIFSQDSSRMMSAKPNLQNAPRQSRIKEVFVAKEGYSYIYYDYCLTGDMRLLDSRFRHIKCEDLKEGDQLIGFEETPSKCLYSRKLDVTNIEKIKTFIKPVYEITTTEGVLKCTADHKWYGSTHRKNHLQKWYRTEELKKGMFLTKVCETWETPNNYETGWMGGFLDREGNVIYSTAVAWGQKASGDNKIVFDKSIQIAKKYGFNKISLSKNYNGCVRINPRGLRQGWKMLGMFQPERLMVKAQRKLQNEGLRGRHNIKAKILKIKYIGEQKVYGIRTGTKTFICEGFMSHNCALEFRVWADLSKDTQALEFIKSGKDIHAFIGSQFYKKQYDYFLNKKDEEASELRNRVKSTVYGSMYGRTPFGIVKEHGGSEEDAEQIQKIFFNLCREGHFWLKQIEQKVFKDKQLRTPFGTPRFFQDIELAQEKEREGIIREAKSFIVQSWAIELVYIGLYKVWKKVRELKLDAHFVHFIYDGLIMEVKDSQVETVKKIVLEEAQNPYKLLSVPLTVDLKIGKAWSDVA